MLKIDDLGTSQGRHDFRRQLRRPWDASPKFMRHWINPIVFTSWWYAETVL